MIIFFRSVIWILILSFATYLFKIILTARLSHRSNEIENGLLEKAWARRNERRNVWTWQLGSGWCSVRQNCRKINCKKTGQEKAKAWLGCWTRWWKREDEFQICARRAWPKKRDENAPVFYREFYSRNGWCTVDFRAFSYAVSVSATSFLIIKRVILYI